MSWTDNQYHSTVSGCTARCTVRAGDFSTRSLDEPPGRLCSLSCEIIGHRSALHLALRTLMNDAG